MSSNLTLCVRDRSSPVGQNFNTTRPISYSEYNTLLTNYSSPVAKFLTGSFVMDESLSIPNPEQQKKRRFHPLRNLRRIFRRRTINTTSETSINALEPQLSVSERNLRSATLSAISKTASSQSQQFAQQELHDTFSSQSLPKFKSCGKSEQEIGNAPFNKVHLHEHHQQDLKEDSFVQSDMCATAQNLRTSLFHNTQLKQSLGDSVFPNSKNCDFSKEHKLLSANDYSSSNLCLSDYDSINKLISEHKTATSNTRKVPPRTSLQEMSNSQRSLIDERFFENGNNCEGLSQSHDSVFSHSATASNLSIVLKEELTDVLRKRLNRSEVSDEDIMFSHIPSLPNRRVQTDENEFNSDINRQNDENFTTVGKNICAEESNYSSVSCSRSLVSSSEQIPLNLSLEGRDNTDFFSSHRQMLSHDAAKHKMAIRPIKRKAPSHLKRRNVDIAAKKTNDKEISKFAYNDITNTHDRNLTFNSYPSPKFAIETNREQYNTKTSTHSSLVTNSDLKQTTIKTTGVPEKINRTIILNSNINNELGSKDGTIERNNAPYIETRESGFLRRLINRNSKRSITKSPVDQLPIDQSEPKKMQLNTPCYDTKLSFTNIESKKPSVNTNFQDNIGMAKKEKPNATKMEIEPMKNSNPVQEGNDKLSDKPKSGPAARQRCMPKNISEKINDNNEYNEIFQSTSLIKEISSTQIQNSSSLSTLKSDLNHNKILKVHESMPISGKITRSFECIGPAVSSNSMETSTDDPLDYYEEKQRRVVEKSRSFKNQQEALASSTINNNLPSLPDLPISIRVPRAYLDEYILTGKRNSPPSPHDEQSKRASLGFEINDNNLLNIKTNVNASPTQTRKQRNGVALSTGSEVTTNHINSVNDIPTLPEIEQNIDMIVKSSFPQYPGKRFEQPLFHQQNALKKHIKNDDFAAHIQNSEKKRPRELYFLEKVNERTPDITTVPLREKTMSLNLPTEKDVKFLDRKSVPVNQVRDQVADQSRSANRSLPIVSSNAVKINASLPEFLKIHLNPIEQDRTKKAGNLVLAKNVRQQIQTPSVNKSDCTSSVDHASSQLSNSFLSINECPPILIQQSASPHPSNLVVRSRQNETISPGIVNRTTIFNTSKKPVSKLLEDPVSPNKELFIDTSVKLSIQERKRIFLSEDNSKTPIRKSEHTNNNNGNKSNLVELNLRSSSKPDEIPSVLPPDSSSIEPSLVVLRKKSFRSNLPSGSNADTSLNETDGTPELMKVFARRSLKIKDDEIKTANDKENIVNLGTSNLNKKFNAVGSTKCPSTQINVDSDKENQSTSAEKLDKITKNEKCTLGSVHKNLNDNGSWTNSNVSNRNSVADFRQCLGKFTGNSNNNHNSNTTLHPTKLSHLPLKKGVFISGNTEQAAPSNINTTNKPNPCIENKNNDIEIKPITIYKRENSENACEPGSNALSNNTKTIERSATVGEFKGIHQRRAEWEQRVKEAFK